MRASVAPGVARRPPAFLLAGDIVSNTGYARASRGLAAMIAERFPVYGLSLQEDPNDRSQPFPGELVSRGEVAALAATRRLFVVQHATPDRFTVFPGAYNIGVFAWETLSIPRHLDWPARLASVDALWGPTRFVDQFARRCGYDGPFFLTPWVQQFDAPPAASPVPAQVGTWLLDTMPASDTDAPPPIVPAASLRARASTRLLAVQSLAPRKGLPLLLAEWRRFLAANPSSDCLLVLKLSFRHAHGIAGTSFEHFVRLLRRYGARPGERVRLAVIDAQLADPEMDSLIADSDLYVSATLGEGFGMPITEALRNGTPVLVSRHTGIADLLPDAYPFQVAYDEASVGLRDNMEVYPFSATWAIPREGAIAEGIARFEAMSPAERPAVPRAAVRHADSFCGVNAVRERLFAALDAALEDAR